MLSTKVEPLYYVLRIAGGRGFTAHGEVKRLSIFSSTEVTGNDDLFSHGIPFHVRAGQDSNLHTRAFSTYQQPDHRTRSNEDTIPRVRFGVRFGVSPFAPPARSISIRMDLHCLPRVEAQRIHFVFAFGEASRRRFEVF